jgi:two-component system, NtrC family, nitrogen regulation response regulator NtrX
MPTSASLRPPGRRVAEPPPPAPASPATLAGDSAPIRRARTALDLPGVGPLLILAEDGLEAPAVARYVHERTRAGQPFLHVDCADPDVSRVHAAVFGERTRGTGHELESLGPGSVLVAARRGTVFLDNIADLPAAVQRGLARVLRDGEARVGGRDRVRVTARVVASAPPSLPADARDGRFRADLLRRFGALPVIVPPLRERADDLRVIVHRVASEISAAAGRPAPAFTQAALTVLAAMPWPGNLDELRTTLQRVLRDAAGTVRQEDLLHLLPLAPLHGIGSRVSPSVSLREARRHFEREYIAAVLEQHDWRMSEAARTLGIERANLYRKARQLGIVRAAPGRRPSAERNR